MSIVLSQKNTFLFPELKFPSHLFCSYVFNRIFQNGDSFNDIEDYAKNHSSSTQANQDPSTSSLIQYNLKSDIWGSKEVILLGKYKIPELDFSIAHGYRDNSQFDKILQFLYSHQNISVYSEQEGNYIFLFQNSATNLKNKIVMINVQKETTQSIKIGISFKG